MSGDLALLQRPIGGVMWDALVIDLAAWGMIYCTVAKALELAG